MRFLAILISFSLLTGCAPTGSDAPEPDRVQDSPTTLATPEIPEASESVNTVDTPSSTDFSDADFLYPASVTGTDFDIITEVDPTTFCRLEYTGRSRQEMPDKTNDGELFAEAITFNAHFNHGSPIAFAMDKDYELAEAEADALRYAIRLGKLPFVLRNGVNRLVVHSGQPDTTAFSDVGLIVLYSANAMRRIETNDLEETLFHESVHASWDIPHAASAGWRSAQIEDNFFITNYAKGLPAQEDLAESALFAYALSGDLSRLPATDAEAISRAIPARIALVQSLFQAAAKTPAEAGCPDG